MSGERRAVSNAAMLNGSAIQQHDNGDNPIYFDQDSGEYKGGPKLSTAMASKVVTIGDEAEKSGQKTSGQKTSGQKTSGQNTGSSWGFWGGRRTKHRRKRRPKKTRKYRKRR